MSRKESGEGNLEVELVHVDADYASGRLRRAFKPLLNAAGREQVKGAGNAPVDPESGEVAGHNDAKSHRHGSPAESDID